MKATDSFKEIISEHLKGLAAKDPLFAETLKKPKKNIDDCVTYILNAVKTSGRSGFTDQEIFGMAVHYYDEDDIKPGAAVKNYRVVTNRAPKLSKEEIEAAKKDAYNSVVKAEIDRLKQKPTKHKGNRPEVLSPSLFD
ncbi:PcfK-like family protein [Parapedobacter indicus]|uniref:PcfK-like protein n=1 Tax=Parapedobacter indicus TaxID=1477437 RepID=A0A1I3E0P2_9SPHI|nr:PcfK-like family protein [Parapedobacter indicus]PPL04921.1 PcfK-like protein [Parapedobacter indicus]SFH92562.1 PcfK-like protein [Parapedobacter indicus]